MKKGIAVFFSLLLAVSCLQAADLVDNPAFKGWEKFKVGATAKFLEVQQWEATRIETQFRFTLLELETGKALVEKETVELKDGVPQSPKIEKIEFLAKIPSTDPTIAKVPEAEVAKGEEELEIEGEKLTCQVIETKIKQGKAEGYAKSFYHKEIPGGLVKRVEGMHSPEEKVNLTLVLMEKRIP